MIHEKSVVIMRFLPTFEIYAFFPYVYVAQNVGILYGRNIEEFTWHTICTYEGNENSYAYCSPSLLTDKHHTILNAYTKPLFPNDETEIRFLTKIPEDAYNYRVAKACTYKFLQNA